MTLNHRKIIFILPHPTWKADEQNQILQLFFKMRSEIDIQILPDQELIQPSKILTLSSLYVTSFLFRFTVLESAYRVGDKIPVINFFDDDTITSTHFKLADLYNAYFNVFNDEDVLKDLVGRGYRLDYSKDVVLNFWDKDHNFQETNMQKLVKCLVQ